MLYFCIIQVIFSIQQTSLVILWSVKFCKFDLFEILHNEIIIILKKRVLRSYIPGLLVLITSLSKLIVLQYVSIESNLSLYVAIC